MEMVECLVGGSSAGDGMPPQRRSNRVRGLGFALRLPQRSRGALPTAAWSRRAYAWPVTGKESGTIDLTLLTSGGGRVGRAQIREI